MDKSTQTEEGDIMTPKIVHAKCNNNYSAVQRSKLVGCFSCIQIFDAKQVVNYCRRFDKETDEELPLETHEGDAICPKCSTDSILPDAVQKLSIELLVEMEKIWFN